MPPTALLPQPARPRGQGSMADSLMPDLERFWPTRRCNAFDEFCR
ncbi:MAG TPA: hypothetical protein VD813_13825 [Pseudonocardia sp.]|nr:hypothetical protein [Pseudonocardia sp.]